MEEALKLAMKGGYEITDNLEILFPNSARPYHLLRPLFWQALGKSLGWKELWYYGWFVNIPHGGEWKWVEGKDTNVYWGGKPNECPNIVTMKESWEHHWHSFIDYLAAGKPIDDFFSALISTK